MTSTRFDALPCQPYARCMSCSAVLETKDAASEHMSSTVEAVDNPTRSGIIARGHRLHVVNRTRAERIKSHVEAVVTAAVERYPGTPNIVLRELPVSDEAVEQAMDDLDEDVHHGHLTDAEVFLALAGQPEFLAAWRKG